MFAAYRKPIVSGGEFQQVLHGTNFPGSHSRLEKLSGWKKTLAGNDTSLEQPGEFVKTT